VTFTPVLFSGRKDMATATQPSRGPFGRIGTFQPECPVNGSTERVPAQVSPDVAVAVTRLLAIAVSELRRHGIMEGIADGRMPEYRSWPMIETLPRSGGRAVRFYVCPKGVLASDEEFFPVGTQFVMEKSDDRRMQLFVMKKYAALHFSEHAARDREVWISTRFLVAYGGVTRGGVLPANR
jgi:hypothetical protein